MYDYCKKFLESCITVENLSHLSQTCVNEVSVQHIDPFIKENRCICVGEISGLIINVYMYK